VASLVITWVTRFSVAFELQQLPQPRNSRTNCYATLQNLKEKSKTSGAMTMSNTCWGRFGV
jgi:hypothetical protein